MTRQQAGYLRSSQGFVLFMLIYGYIKSQNCQNILTLEKKKFLNIICVIGEEKKRKKLGIDGKENSPVH